MTRARDVANLIGSGNYSSTTFTATAGQTVFSIAHTQNFVQVFMNGLLLDLTVDYTSNGSAVTLTSGAAAGDEIEVVAYNTFSVGDALNQAAADTRYVNATGDSMTGSLIGTSAGFTGDVNIGNNDASNPVSKLRLGATLYGAADIVPVSTGHKIGLDFKTDSTGDTTIDPVTRMSISNEGYVTKPNQPFFDGYMSANYTTGSSGVYNISTSASWGAHVNTGSHFNASNGTFTAPIAGRYLFHAGLGVQSYPTSSYLSCEFQVNGSRRYIHWFSNYGTSYAAATNTAVINLNASDYVRLASETHVSATFLGTGSGAYSHFGGYLLG